MSNEPQRHQLSDDGPIAPCLSPDLAFDVLADDQRRTVLSYFLERDRQAELRELASHVRSSESHRVNDGIAASLHHVHLPKLADAGLIQYDPDEKVATATRSVDELALYLRWATHRGH